MKTITMEFAKNGQVKITTTGFEGATCKEATKALEARLGGAVESDVETPEMYLEATTENKNIA